MLVRWLPVGRHWFHHGAHNSLCPCCGDPNETFEHLFVCSHKDLEALRATARVRILRALRQEQFPSRLIQVVDMMLRKVLDQERPQELPLKGWPKAFKRIWARQRRLGFENFVKGWITKEWRRVLQSRRYQSKDAVSQVAQMITAIWEILCEPLWELRNNILARTDNPTVLREQKTLQERLHWFKRFAGQVLAQRHRKLTDFAREEVSSWNRKQCRKRLKTLEIAREIYEIECRQRVRGQRVMTEWLEARLIHDTVD